MLFFVFLSRAFLISKLFNHHPSYSVGVKDYTVKSKLYLDIIVNCDTFTILTHFIDFEP